MARVFNLINFVHFIVSAVIDWPDYSSESSDDSQVEPIVGGSTSDISTPPHSSRHSNKLSANPLTSSTPAPNRDISQGSTLQSPDIPNEDHTAQKIMHLLSELGSSNVLDRTSFIEKSYVNCSHCSGRLQTV